jgi:hypothetical protein
LDASSKASMSRRGGAFHSACAARGVFWRWARPISYRSAIGRDAISGKRLIGVCVGTADSSVIGAPWRTLTADLDSVQALDRQQDTASVVQRVEHTQKRCLIS